MGKEYESLNSVLDRVYMQRKKEGKCTDKADPENAKKDYRNIIFSLFKVIDLDKKNLVDSNNRYCFTEKESEYIYRLLMNSSNTPFKELRKGQFEKVITTEFEQLEKFICGCMKNAGKDSESIEKQVVAFRQRTGWLYRRDIDNVLNSTSSKLCWLFFQIREKHCFNVNNRLDMLSAINYSLDKLMNTYCKQWTDAMDEASEILDEILIDHGIEMGDYAPPEYWMAKREAEDKIYTKKQNKALCESEGERDKMLCEPESERDKTLCELEEKLPELENGTIGDVNEAAEMRRKIKNRKVEIEKECFERYGIDSATVEKVENMGTMGHGKDDLVIRIIEKTLRELLNTEDISDWERYSGDAKATEETDATEGKATQLTDEERIEEKLKGLESKIDRDVLNNWFEKP